MRRLVGFAALAAAAALVLAATAASGDEPKPEAGMAGKMSVNGHGPKKHGKGGIGFLAECAVTSSAPNTSLDCDDPFPNNEPDLVVDPAAPQHLIASSNDYGSCCDEFYTSLDAGHTWHTGNMSIEDPTRTGSDPVTTIDRSGKVALHSSLNYVITDTGELCDGDVVVSPSKDGGLVWTKPVVVGDGQGCDSSATQVFNDKPWITTDNNPASRFYGRSYLTWTRFELVNGVNVRSAIFLAHSDNHGKKWSEPQEISGSNPALCTSQATGPAGQCDEDQFSVPAVAPDGSVYVAFENSQNQAIQEPGETGDDQYLIVRSNDGGKTWSAPTFVVGLEDGSRDYPINAEGSQTLTGYQARLDSAGNVAIDPRTGRLYIVFSDNRAGIHDSAHPITNANVYLMTSTDGITWSGPTLVDPSPSDQWFPWVDVNPVNGTVGVLYNDRSTSNPDTYGAALAERTTTSPMFAKTTVSTAPSNPVDSLFFQAGVPGCEKCTVFNGDYITVAYGSDGKANMVWTDMRQHVWDPDLGDGFAESIVFARH